MFQRKALAKRRPLSLLGAVKFAEQTWRELRSNSQSGSYVLDEARARLSGTLLAPGPDVTFSRICMIGRTENE